ncbi:glycosyl hydrolase [Paenibacillus sp. MY03]|uniref:glycoside hydrolase family 88 protein n=1 Tax=Paenibacillus sp. MY03 TaxID=302980 RepID=UPI000B558DF7|nr:glycoside hydrolase family 88 protein [Paenibacillus sp. MY03]OUS69192.1 glycosyl hydrolase [Paenibacillus sp. MY03]
MVTNKPNWAIDAWEKGKARAIRSSARIGAGFPHGSASGQYHMMSPTYWTAGFWPGLLWLLEREQPNAELRLLAEQCEAKLDPLLSRYDELSHDIGFMWTLTAVANNKLTGNADSRNRGLVAASILAGRFNAKGRFIRAWNQPERTGWAIIDCMMNLPLLYWASEQLNDPRFRHVAEAHASTTAEQFQREDGSIFHVVFFDPASGERVGAAGGQGYAEHSAWARGTAWGIYGFALSYRHTGDAKFLQASERAADFFVRSLPEDLVPYWDFRLPSIERAPRDSSAAAIAASGLLELAAAGVERAEEHRANALAILESLSRNYVPADDDAEEGLLLHGTGNLPMNQNIDSPIIYGDYYYMEALSKVLHGGESFWSPAVSRVEGVSAG